MCIRDSYRPGRVDVLGIGQDLVAPGDGLIGVTLVEAGEPVEYGQAVIVLEQLAEPRPHAASATAAQSGPAESGPAESGPAAAGPPGDDGAPATGVA